MIKETDGNSKDRLNMVEHMPEITVETCYCSKSAEVDDYDTQGAIMLLTQVEQRDGQTMVQPELNEVGIVDEGSILMILVRCCFKDRAF